MGAVRVVASRSIQTCFQAIHDAGDSRCEASAIFRIDSRSEKSGIDRIHAR